MRFRNVLFWLHLSAGLLAGLSIAIMCFTGTILAFEKELVAWSERDARIVVPPPGDAPRLSLDELARRVREAKPDTRLALITVSADPRVAVTFLPERQRTLYANPYTGEVRAPTSTRMRDFMQFARSWHRWLAISGDNRPIGKAINGACNIAFCVLAITGLYLWMPRSWSWRNVRAVALFNARLSGKARDFNWHNTIGVWCAPVLIVLTLTALPISYRWASDLAYRLGGDEPPRPGAALPNNAAALPTPPAGAKPLSQGTLFDAAERALPNWEEVTLRLFQQRGRGPEGKDAVAQPVAFAVKTPGTWPRTASTTVLVNPYNAEIFRREAFADQTPGRRLRFWTRFLHTGEALGWPGQLVAGLASLGGCFLAYTGVALSWRRFFGRR